MSYDVRRALQEDLEREKALAHDPVERPDHYTMGMEVFDFIESWDMDFASGNVIKYVTRAPYKGKPLQDLRKARWYLDRLIKSAEG